MRRFRIVLPLIGSGVSGDCQGAYRYLPQSVGEFHAERVLTEWLGQVGFVNVTAESMCGGAVLAVKGYKQ